jgi:hypothetical protein
VDKVTRRSFVATVGAASVVPATALLSAAAFAVAKPTKASRVAEPADSSEAAAELFHTSLRAINRDLEKLVGMNA